MTMRWLAPHQLGGMPERLIGVVSKTIILERVSEVQILLPPLKFGAGLKKTSWEIPFAGSNPAPSEGGVCRMVRRWS